ncbi:MAG TPA: TlpA disulfide reductase family protein [Pedobacter sp.]|jgi:peroxiredoxin
MALKSFLSFLLLLFVCRAFSQTDNGSLTKIGDPAPSFKVEVDKGVYKDLKDYRGKLVMINFFATWCPPCAAELPRVQNDIWDKYKDNPKFALMVIGREEDWKKLDPFKAKHNYTFPILPDTDRQIFSKYATQAIPRNIIIDGDGKIVYQSIGYTEGEFKKMLILLAKKLK